MPQELEELFLEHCQMVHRTAYAITPHRQDAEDVLQSIFVRLLQRGLTTEIRVHPARYLHRAAVNLSRLDRETGPQLSAIRRVAGVNVTSGQVF